MLPFEIPFQSLGYLSLVGRLRVRRQSRLPLIPTRGLSV